MSTTIRQSLELLLDHLPPGTRRWWALAETDGLGGMVWSIAEALKTYGHDILDELRAELTWSRVTARLPDWEAALALARTRIAVSGSIENRRAQVTSRRRENGGPTPANVKAALAAICGYEPTIISHSRAAVTAVNKVAIAPTTVGPLTVTPIAFHAADNAVASQAGVRLSMTLEFDADPANFALTLTPPSGPVLTIDQTRFTSGVPRLVFWPAFAGRSITGTWTLTIGNGDLVGSVIVKPGAYMLAEGIGRNQWGADGHGALLYEWSAAINETLVDPDTYDRGTVVDIVRRWNPAHARGGVALYQTDGDLCALADDPNCLADLTVAC